MYGAYEQWFEQSDYDLASADVLFEASRYLHAVLLGHMALEKAVKGLYQAKRRGVPPKSRNLIFLFNEVGMRPPEGLDLAVATLNEAVVATRHSDSIQRLHQVYTRFVAERLIGDAKKVIEWTRKQC